MRTVWLLMPILLAIVCMCKFGWGVGVVIAGLWALRFILRLVWKVLKLTVLIAIVTITIHLLIL